MGCGGACGVRGRRENNVQRTGKEIEIEESGRERDREEREREEKEKERKREREREGEYTPFHFFAPKDPKPISSIICL